MFELKRLSPEGIQRAMEKVERYRLLNEPWEAESICRDVLDVDPDNQAALISLILALADQMGHERGPSVDEPGAILSRLKGEYDREYYAGIICERKATIHLKRGQAGAGPLVYDWLRRAMDHYDRAEKLRPAGNEDAVVRWNTCVRLIRRHDHVREPSRERGVTFLE